MHHNKLNITYMEKNNHVIPEIDYIYTQQP